MPNLAGLLHEVDNWESAWLTLPYECLPNTVTETLQMTNNIAFPTISTVMKSLGVLPIERLRILTITLTILLRVMRAHNAHAQKT